MAIIKSHDLYIKAMSGTAMNEEEIMENKRLVEKFPWLWPSDFMWVKIPEEEYDYTWTILDEFPVGWKKAFAEKMCEEIQEVLEQYGRVETFHIDQLKEKYGKMRLYFSGAVGEAYSKLRDIIHKYETVSTFTCCKCGKPATRVSSEWICPYCDDCGDGSCMAPIDEFYKYYDNYELILNNEGLVVDVKEKSPIR